MLAGFWGHHTGIKGTMSADQTAADIVLYSFEWDSVQNRVCAVTFPYGNQYGWGIAHRKNKKLICHVFPEENAFTVMMRLSNKQFDSIYGKVQTGTQEQIDHKYPCGDGGWLHYCVTSREQFDDIQTLLTAKCA